MNNNRASLPIRREWGPPIRFYRQFLENRVRPQFKTALSNHGPVPIRYVAHS